MLGPWIRLVSGNATDVTRFGAHVLCTSGSSAEVIPSISVFSSQDAKTWDRCRSKWVELAAVQGFPLESVEGGVEVVFALFAGVFFIAALERSLGVVVDPNRRPHEEIVELIQLVTQHMNSVILSGPCSGKGQMLPRSSACRYCLFVWSFLLRCLLLWFLPSLSPCGASFLKLDFATAHSVW